MGVPSKSLWLFYLFCQLFFYKPIKYDKFLFKEIFLLQILLFSDNFSEVETFIWEDHIDLDCCFYY